MSVVFTESLDPSSVIDRDAEQVDAVRLQRGDEIVEADVMLDWTDTLNDTVVLRPRVWTPGIYRVVVTEDVRRTDGVPLGEPYETVFEVR